MTAKFQELVAKLKEIFQLDKPELDFGLYRIMHAKSAEVTDFLEHRLEDKVREALSGNAEAEKQALQQELDTLSATLQQAGIDPETSPKVKELRDRIAAADEGIGQAEGEVYSHLLTFFGRYYDQGDFISKRRYNGDKYAIPYAGEEVKLHWANADQYYIKSGENFTNYDFTLDGGAKVHFKLVAAATAKDNIKDADAERRFMLWRPEEASAEDDEDAEPMPTDICEEKNGELFIYFQYRKCKKGTKQSALIEEAERLVIDRLAQLQLAMKYPLAVPAPTEKDRNRSLLRKHLERYTAKNTCDYFIHKDLQGFLTRELDFYIKNEMLHLDDLRDAAAIRHIERQLRQINAVRTIAGELIAFMAQLENFQKRLWLKKKFVTRCEWCVTMDRLPEDLRVEALANPQQQEEWRKLGFAEPDGGRQARLPDMDTAIDARMVDTKFFDESFKARLLRAIPDIDEQCDGVLIHSENFQALNLLQERYTQNISGIHIDPPYNTETSGFIYKNNFRHSSWLTMVDNRLLQSISLLNASAILMCHIDENEYERLKVMIDRYDLIDAGTLIWDKRNPMTGGGGTARQHEYVICCINDEMQVSSSNENAMIMIDYVRNLIANNGGKVDEYIRTMYSRWIRENKLLTGGEKSYTYIDDSGRIYSSVSLRAPEPRINPKFHQPLIHPKTNKPCPVPPNGFSRTPETLQAMIERGEILFGKDETTQPRQKRFLSSDEKKQLTSVIIDAKKGKTDLSPMTLDFPYCHSVSFYRQLVSCMTSKNKRDIVLDYFAGSGTTAHAVIALNREDGGKRKYILVEMAEHFDTVLKPRIEKVVYSPDWKDGKPTSADKGISHCFKYMTLESYEDALGNIEPADRGKGLLGLMRDEYLLHYMLELDARASLINTDSFKHPFDYRLKIAVDAGGATEKRKIDLIETFNYLIGLTVQGQDRHIDKGYVFVDGTLPNGDAALVIWRDVEKVDNAALNRLLERRAVNPGDTEYAVIFVNGDHAIPNRKLGAAEGAPELKIRQLENVFLQKMFAED